MNIKKQLERIINNYDLYKNIAANIDFIDIEEKHFEKFAYPFGIYLHWYRFPRKYISQSFLNAFVRATLSAEAYYEEWESDFWNISVEERMECLISGRDMYAQNVIYKDIRMTGLIPQKLWQDITEYMKWKEADADIKNTVLNGSNYEIGGSYIGDHCCVSVKGDELLLSYYGVWD